MKFSLLSAFAALALIQTSTQSAIDTRAVKPNLITIIVTKTLVTYDIYLKKSYKHNGVYSWDKNWSLTVTNAPTKVNLHTSATSTVLSTSTRYLTVNGGKGKTTTQSTTITIGGPTASIEDTDSTTISSMASSTVSSAAASATSGGPVCGVPNDGPTELGWQTSAGNYAASSWEDCYWICYDVLNYCQSFTFASNGAMPAGQECIIMKAAPDAVGIYSNIGDAAGDFVLYEPTCTPPVNPNPVDTTDVYCNEPFYSSGGPSSDTFNNNLLATYKGVSEAQCQAYCTFFAGWCASYNAHIGIGYCYLFNVTMEAPGAYIDFGETEADLWSFMASDAGCPVVQG